MNAITCPPHIPRVRPCSISTTNAPHQAFSDGSMAFAALNIIRLCQSLSGEEWQHFSHQQISKRLKHWSLNTTMGFKRLVKEDFVVQGQDGFFRLTEDLIMKCYLTAPANLQVDEPADEHYCA